MNQNIQENVCRLLKTESTYKDIKPYLDKISQQDQKCYEPICKAIQSAFKEQDPIQCFQAARMAKEAIERQNNDFLTVFQDICLDQYEQLAQDTLNVKLADKAIQFFKRNDNASSFGTSFFHLILESIQYWAMQYPKKNDGITPTKFYQIYQKLSNKGIKFPQANYFKGQPSNTNNINNQQLLDLLRDQQQQQMMMKQQHDIELSIKEQSYKIGLHNLQEQIENQKNFQQILEEQLLEYKRNEDKNKNIQQEFSKAQLKLKQLETELRNSKQQEGYQQNDIIEKQNLYLNIQQLNEQIQELQRNNQVLTQKIKKQENERQPQNDSQFQIQLKELEQNNQILKMELDKKIKEIQEQKIQCLEKESTLHQIKLQQKAKEKLITDSNEQKNQEAIQIRQKLENNIQDLIRKIKSIEGENKSQLQNQQEYQKKNQQLEDKILNLQQQLLVSENKIKELQIQLNQLNQLNQESPIKTNSNKTKQQNSTLHQNFFPQEIQQNIYQKYFNPIFDFNDDFNILFAKPKPVEVENLNKTLFFPYQTPEQYYSNISQKQHKGQEIPYQNFISILKDMKQKNKYLFQIFNINRTKNYFIDQTLIQVAILKQVQKQGLQCQVKYGIYFKSEEQSINLQGRFFNSNQMLNCFSSSQTDFNITLKRQQQYLLEYSISDKCKELVELPVLEINYKDKIQQLFLPMPLFSFIDFQPVTKENFKKYWKQSYIFRSNKFIYNLLILPQHDCILNISKNLILINEEKLMPYLQGIDEIKYGAQIQFINLQFEGLLKFELMPQNQMIIYVGVKKDKYQQFQYLIPKIINSYHSIFQII